MFGRSSNVLETRRRLLRLVAFALAASPAQVLASETRRLAVLMGGLEDRAWEAALRESLAKRGWIDGRNVRIEYRWGAGDATTMRRHAVDLVQRSPHLIVVRSATGLREARRVAGAIPIVFLNVSDPVENGFVQNLARPGGTITGFSNFDYEIAGKWLEHLHELAPQIRRVFVLQSRNNPNWPGWLKAIDAAAPALGFAIVPANVTQHAHIEPSLAAFAREVGGALLVLPDPFLAPHRDAVIALAAKYRLPAVYGGSAFDDGQGLLFYGVDTDDLARNAASYIDRIFKGESPGILPVQSPTKFKPIVNARVARSLGLAVPSSLRSRADRIVE